MFNFSMPTNVNTSQTHKDIKLVSNKFHVILPKLVAQYEIKTYHDKYFCTEIAPSAIFSSNKHFVVSQLPIGTLLWEMRWCNVERRMRYC